MIKIAGEVYLKISPLLLSWHQMFIFILKSDIESCTIGMRITQRNGLSVFLSSGYVGKEKWGMGNYTPLPAVRTFELQPGGGG